ncbi:MAG: hypothetical protein KDD47_14985, partial [Acidobacteria bacterium]|nr:hypothetical protein [Acidobacteriota bacterium]
PGNVRELKNAMERAAIFCGGGAVQPDHLPAELRNPSPAGGKPAVGASFSWPVGTDFQAAKTEAIELFERTFLGQALERAKGNLSQAAREIGIHRQNLQKKLRQLDLDAGTWSSD